MKLFKKVIYFMKERDLLRKRLAKQTLDYWRDHPQGNMPFGILIRLVHALQHGMVNLLLVSLKNIVFMNQ